MSSRPLRLIRPRQDRLPRLTCPRCGSDDVVYGFGSLQLTVAMCRRCWKAIRQRDRERRKAA